MATTVNHHDSRFTAEPEEDIAAIAKQISDHAEAIYQTWKARGLAPNEILTCHNNINAADKFGSVLTPPSSQTSPNTKLSPTSKCAVNSNLDRFVNKYVSNGKTASSAQQPKSPVKTYPSSIQYALEKFEKIPENKPQIRSSSSHKSVSESTLKPTSSSSKTTFLSNKPKSTSFESADRIFPERLIPSSNAPTMIKPTDLVDWSSKNNGEKLSKKGDSEYLDQVAQEEEKLINALKTGLVIDSKSILGKPTLKGDENKNSNKYPNEPISSSRGDTSGPVRRSVRNFRLMENQNSDNANSSQMRINHQSKSGTSASNSNPVRPFLTRGSVAERVLIFEKCPTEMIEKRTKGNVTAPWKELGGDVHSKIQTYSKDSNCNNNSYAPHTTLQRHTKANKNVFIPRFYYKHGKPVNQHQQNAILKNIRDAFQALPNKHATKEQFATITKACGCPLYWKAALFIACGGEKLGFVEMDSFLDYWKDLSTVCHDEASRFMRIITRNTNRQYFQPEDLIPLVQDVVNTHPGLTFLKQAPEFHSRYVHTVICRVFYCVNQSWSGQITLTELRKSNFLRGVQLLEEEEDINQITAYFSYEHFYVIYCKFWELDRDHDLYISTDDLARHSDYALSTRIIERIFNRTKNKSRNNNNNSHNGKMSYTDFVIFLLAEEDKRHPRAIEYWFRCMDLDGDGYISMYEMEYFYDEQLQRMEAMGIECLPFEDCLCQMLDMIQPKIPGKISLSDLKRCKMTSIFFDTFFNLEKYLDHEQKDPFTSQRDPEDTLSDWDRYAAEEYELLVAEEGIADVTEVTNDVRKYDKDDEDEEGEEEEDDEDEDDDIFSSNLELMLNGEGTGGHSLSFVNTSNKNNEKDNRNNNNNNERERYHYDIMNHKPIMSVTDYSQICRNGGDNSDDDDYAADSDDGSI